MAVPFSDGGIASTSFVMIDGCNRPGDRILFSSSGVSRILNLYQKSSSGLGQDELLPATGNHKVPTQWSRDGFIVHMELDPTTRGNIWVLPMQNGVEWKPALFLRSESDELYGQLSPDGHWMAYTSDESGQREVYMRPFPSGERQWKISIAGASNRAGAATARSCSLSVQMER